MTTHLEFKSSRELTDAVNVLGKLEAEARTLPQAITQAVEGTSAVEIINLRQRESVLDVELWAARARVLSLQIANKEAERAELQSALDRVEGELEEAAEVWQGIRDAEMEAAEEHGRLQVRAFGIESQRQSLFEDIAELKRERAALMATRINGKGDGDERNQ